MTQPRVIQDQVKLPLSVAMEVVLQGIRIRLGRSVVTIMGVVLGIAFLMSILTGQLAQQGVGREMQLRAEVKRMMSMLTAESGPLAGRAVGVIHVGPLDETEGRLVRAILAERPAQVRWHAAGGASVPADVAGTVTACGASDVGGEVVAVLAVGDGPMPAVDLDAVMSKARQKVLAASRASFAMAAGPGITRVNLSRQLRPEEAEALAREQSRARFRSVWIIIISLAVTVIGISNAMLTSVTERFREIGTMKCLGALSSFIRRLFLIESSLLGSAGGLAGSLFGAAFALTLYGMSYGFGIVLGSVSWSWLILYGVLSVVAGVILSVIAALYPASFASRMVPATALRSNI